MQKLKLLVVEDDIGTLEIIVNFLNDDYILKVAHDGKRALEIYNIFKPDVIISDLGMPKLNGIDMIKQIRLKDQNIKIIVLTSHDEVEYLLKATELKLTKYLVKPIKKDELLEAIAIAKKDIYSYHIISNDFVKFVDNFSWDINNCELRKDDVIVQITPKERKVLSYLFTNTCVIKTYDDILENVWDDFYETPSKSSLTTLMTGIRKKLPEGIIKNVFGVGYQVEI